MQRQSLILIGLLIGSQAVGQDLTRYENFLIKDRELIYQRTVSNVSTTADKIHGVLRSKTNVRNIELHDSIVYCEFVDYRADGPRYIGKKTPILLRSLYISGKIKYEIRDNRYRVTIYGLFMHKEGSPMTIHNPWLPTANINDFRQDFTDQFVIKRSTFYKYAPTPEFLGLISKGFDDLSDVSGNVKSDDW